MITRENYEIWFLDFAEGNLSPDQQKLLFAFLEKNPDLQKELDSFEHLSFNAETNTNSNELNLKKNTSWLLSKYSEEELLFHVSEGILNAEEVKEWYELVQVNPEWLSKVAEVQKIKLQPDVRETADLKLLLKKTDGLYLITPHNCQEYFTLYTETRELGLHKAIQQFLASHPTFKNDFELTQKTILHANSSIVFEHKEALKKEEKVVALYWWRYAAVAAVVVLAVLFFNPADEASNNPSFAQTEDSLPQKPTLTKQPKSPNLASASETESENKNQTNPTPKNVKQNKRDNNTLHQINTPQKENKSTLPDHTDKQDNFAHTTVKKDSVNSKQNNPTPLQPDQKPNEIFAYNKTNNTSTADPYNTESLKPLEFVASVVNKKYYEEQTPKQEQASPFYAMKNVVNNVSKGNADINKKEDEDYKEFGFKIGDFKFTRKKVKGRELE